MEIHEQAIHVYSSDLGTDHSKLMQLKHIYGDAGGQNIQPVISWKLDEKLSKNVKSFVITCYDPDAPVPKGGWWHWTLYNITSNVRQVDAVSGKSYKHAKNDYGNFEYGGPCPPIGHGIHRYVFTVYALDVETLDVEDKADCIEVVDEASKHILSSGSMVSFYKRD